MSACPTCKAENPPGSKFCAGCGAPLPKTPVNVRCAACGAESPEGSRFCKGCGRPLAVATAPAGPAGPGTAPVRPKAPSENVRRIKMLLGAGAGLYAFGVFLMYSGLEKVRAAYGPYAGQVPGMGLQWFLVVLCSALAAGNIYAVTLAPKGDFKYARWLCAVMVGLGIIFLLRGLSGPVSYILINAGLIACGGFGWRLISAEQRKLAA